MFSAIVRFDGGQVLKVSDKFLRESPDAATRNFSYYFGVPKNDEMERVFLIDNHGFFGGAEHFHPENDERLETGDPRLNGFSPEDTDVTNVLEFIDLYFDNKTLPWNRR